MIKNQTCNKQCSRCGQCCGPSNPITLNEYKVIKNYIREQNIKPRDIKVEDNSIDLRCVFYDTKNKCCSIYPVRPEVCKEFKCDNSEYLIAFNRSYYDKRAEINGNYLTRFVPFDLLFYDIPITALLIASKQCSNQEQLISLLKSLGGDRKFFNQHHIPSCYDVAEAIEDGSIKLEWSE